MANRSVFSHTRLPATRREAREQYAGDDRAESHERDRLFKQNYPKGRAASKRLQNSIGVYNDDIWPYPEPCCLTSSQIVEKNRKQILDALSGCGELRLHLDQTSDNGHSSVSRNLFTAPYPPQDTVQEARFGPVNGPLTEALCQASDLRVTPISELIFENVDTDMTAPNKRRQDLLRHLEVGLDGVKAMVQGQAYFGHHMGQSQAAQSPQLAPHIQQTAACIATRDSMNSCTCQCVTWIFFGILFDQLVEEGNQIPSHWICLGVPERATETCILVHSADGAVDRGLGGGKWLIA